MGIKSEGMGIKLREMESLSPGERALCRRAMQTLEVCGQVGVLGLRVLCDTIPGKNRCLLPPIGYQQQTKV